jgi:hypothetical protein
VKIASPSAIQKPKKTALKIRWIGKGENCIDNFARVSRALQTAETMFHTGSRKI